MASERGNQGGQMILLTGLLLAIAFTVFSLQLALVANIGQQAGRETRNPVLDDYLAIRGELAATLESELRQADGSTPCPTDLTDFERRVGSFLSMLANVQNARGHQFVASVDNVLMDASDPSDKFLKIRLSLVLTDGTTAVQDSPTYFVGCT